MSEQSPDFSKISMDDLTDLVNSTDGTIADEVTLDPDKQAESGEEEATEEAQEATTEEAAEETKKEAEPDKSEGKEETPEIQVPDHVRLRLEAAEAERKKFEALAGRHAGELGFLRNQLKEIRERLESRETDGDTGLTEREAPVAEPRATDDKFAQWAVQQSVQQAIAGFESQYPDSVEMAGAMVDYWNSAGINMGTFMAASDPVSASEETRSALELAYLHAVAKSKYEAAEKAEKEASRRNADEAKTLSGRRRAVASTPTGGVRASATPKGQDPRTMPINDLKSLIDATGAELE